MSDPRRFLDGPEGDPTRALFQAMRADAPSPESKARALAAALAVTATVTAATAAAGIAAKAAAVASAAPAAGMPAPLVPAAAASVPALKLISAFLLGGIVTAAGLGAGTRLLAPTSAQGSGSATAAGTAPLPRHAARPVPQLVLTLDESAAAPLAPSVVAPALSAPGPSPASSRPRGSDREAGRDEAPPAMASAGQGSAAPPMPSAASGPPSLAEEVASLDAARSALSSGDGPGALRALDVFQETFPRARLGTEAHVMRIEALAACGRSSDARAAAETFLASHPDSPFAPRVRRAIGEKANVLTIP